MRLHQLLLAGLCLLTSIATAQKWSTRQGTVGFEASMPGFEPIQGTTTQASALVDVEARQIAVLVRVQEIEFPNDLMEKHFNENYMDSDTYPRMTFSGVWEVESTDDSSLSLKGKLKIRDISREITVPARVVSTAGKRTIRGSFELRPEDYGVQVPRVVRMKIAEVARIRFELPLEPLP